MLPFSQQMPKCLCTTPGVAVHALSSRLRGGCGGTACCHYFTWPHALLEYLTWGSKSATSPLLVSHWEAAGGGPSPRVPLKFLTIGFSLGHHGCGGPLGSKPGIESLPTPVCACYSAFQLKKQTLRSSTVRCGHLEQKQEAEEGWHHWEGSGGAADCQNLRGAPSHPLKDAAKELLARLVQEEPS